MMTVMRVICVAGFAALIQTAAITATPAAYSVCTAADNIHRQHVVCGSAGCPRGEMSVFSTDAVLPMCGSSSAAQAPAAAPPGCGRQWSGWERRDTAVQNPCPSACKRESRIREETRGSGRRAEHRELWQCAPR